MEYFGGKQELSQCEVGPSLAMNSVGAWIISPNLGDYIS